MKSPEKQDKSALKVQEGIEQPSQVNHAYLQNLKRKKVLQAPDYYTKGILQGNRSILSQAITLVESSLESHQEVAQQVVMSCLPSAGNALRLGITGVPGVGKSTFIEAFGKFLTDKGHKVAILAIDPSSQRSKGSILGDKTRMEELAIDPNAFIRPSPSAGSLGGVARKTRESALLCEAAGFDIIIIETVGVGQSETAVHAMTDFFLLLMLSGAGDELQGIKRGIMEMADAILINKADGDNQTRASLARIEYENALHLFPPTESGWKPQVGLCSARAKSGIAEAWAIIGDYCKLTKDNGYFERKREQQLMDALHETINYQLVSRFYGDPKIDLMIKSFKEKMLLSHLSPYAAAQELLRNYHG